MILHHPGPAPDGRPCGHYWHTTRSTASRCPACGGTTGIEVTDRDTLPVSEPVLTKPGETE